MNVPNTAIRNTPTAITQRREGGLVVSPASDDAARVPQKPCNEETQSNQGSSDTSHGSVPYRASSASEG